MSGKNDNTRYTITVIMPALNEELCLEAGVHNVLEGFTRHGVTGELLIVNDGSSDRTAAIAEKLASMHDFVNIIHHQTVQGIGSSIMDGVRSASGEMVVYMPGDGENDASEILRYIKLMNHVDIVVPFIVNRGVRSWRRRMLSTAFQRIVALTFSQPLKYMNGNVIYRKSILEGIKLKSRGFFFQAELLIRTIGSGYLYAEVPCFQRRRFGGRSKSTTFSSLLEVARAYCFTMLDLYSVKGENSKIVSDSVTARRLEEMLPYIEGRSE